MAEIDGTLLFDILRSLQKDMSDVKLTQTEIKAELGAIRGYLISVQQDVHNIYGVMGRHELQLERIERRLDLHDAPALT